MKTYIDYGQELWFDYNRLRSNDDHTAFHIHPHYELYILTEPIRTETIICGKRIITDYPQILDYTSLISTEFQGTTFYSTNTLMREGTVAGIDGLKSGTTRAAGCCFTGTAQREGRRVISVVLNAPDQGARMTDTQALLEYGFARIAEREARKLWHKSLLNHWKEPAWRALTPT